MAHVHIIQGVHTQELMVFMSPLTVVLVCWIQWFGWTGFIDKDKNCVRDFFSVQIVCVIYVTSQLIKLITNLQNPGQKTDLMKFLGLLTAMITTVYMSWSSFKFLQRCETSPPSTSIKDRFLAILIVDMIISIIGIIYLIVVLTTTEPIELTFWSRLAATLVSILLVSLVQFFGWRGYKKGSIKCINGFVIFKVIHVVTMAVVDGLNPLDSHEGHGCDDNHAILYELCMILFDYDLIWSSVGLVILVYMIKTSIWFLEELKMKKETEVVHEEDALQDLNESK